jgi:hypothetical protein
VLLIPATLDAVPIDPQALETVGYLTVSGKPQPGCQAAQKRTVGTCFFVSHSYPERPGSTYVFLVTARRVVLDDQGEKKWPKIFVRMNDIKTGIARDFDILQDDLWFFHRQQRKVDLAVHPVSHRKGKFRAIQSSLWVTDEVMRKHPIATGDEVFYTGLLARDSGTKSIKPITRFGHLALITDKPSVEGKHLHFIDADNIPGHSGSPVFLWATPRPSPQPSFTGARIFALYGIVSNIIEYAEYLKFAQKDVDPIALPMDFRSGDMTGVVPVKYLRDIIEDDRIREVIGLQSN